MTAIIEVVLFAVISTIITIMMTVYYVKHYKEIPMGYPVAMLVVFTLLIIFNSYPIPSIFGDSVSRFWYDVTNGGYLIKEYRKFLTPIGLILLTLKLYCTSNVIILIVYYIVQLVKHFKARNTVRVKENALKNRKIKVATKDDLPEIGDDFSFITEAMPVNGIMCIDDVRFEVLNNTGKKIPTGRKMIYAKRLEDHQQLDSKTDAIQPEEKIPYIEIWSVESI